jgi:hypothetical protein
MSIIWGGIDAFKYPSDNSTDEFFASRRELEAGSGAKP